MRRKTAQRIDMRQAEYRGAIMALDQLALAFRHRNAPMTGVDVMDILLTASNELRAKGQQ